MGYALGYSPGAFALNEASMATSHSYTRTP